MRTITVSIDDAEYSKLGLTDNRICFSELKEKISMEYAKDAISKCHQIAQDTGLSKLTLEEINEEIKAVRDNAANCN